jgi:hypothetical protein
MSHQPNEQAVRSTANQTGAQHASSEIKNLTVIKKINCSNNPGEARQASRQGVSKRLMAQLENRC